MELGSRILIVNRITDRAEFWLEAQDSRFHKQISRIPESRLPYLGRKWIQLIGDNCDK